VEAEAAPDPDNRQIVFLQAARPIRDLTSATTYVVLSREIIRQAFLIPAIDAPGLATLDALLREPTTAGLPRFPSTSPRLGKSQGGSVPTEPSGPKTAPFLEVVRMVATQTPPAPSLACLHVEFLLLLTRLRLRGRIHFCC
jgi:hypothetical protein